jgi:hypothetical protein
MNLEQEILEIKERNKRVESDKAWEVSFVRRGFISVVTYVFAAWWLYIISETNFYFKALVPVIGYLLSTWSLPIIKTKWLKNKTR